MWDHQSRAAPTSAIAPVIMRLPIGNPQLMAAAALSVGLGEGALEVVVLGFVLGLPTRPESVASDVKSPVTALPLVQVLPAVTDPATKLTTAHCNRKCQHMIRGLSSKRRRGHRGGTNLVQGAIWGVCDNTNDTCPADPALGRRDNRLAEVTKAGLEDDREQLCPIAAGLILESTAYQPLRLRVSQSEGDEVAIDVEVSCRFFGQIREGRSARCVCFLIFVDRISLQRRGAQQQKMGICSRKKQQRGSCKSSQGGHFRRMFWTSKIDLNGTAGLLLLTDGQSAFNWQMGGISKGANGGKELRSLVVKNNEESLARQRA